MKAIFVASVGILILGLSSCTPVSPIDVNQTSQIASQTDAQPQQIVKIAPSSSTVTVLKVLAEAYQAKNKTVKFEFVSLSQSRGTIAALENDIVDIAGISHQLKREEDNGKIQYRELAKDLLIIATHSSVQGVTNLTTKDLRAIYRGDIANWKELGGPDATILVLDRPEDESAKKLLRQYYLSQDKTTSKAIILNKEGELIQTLQDTPYSIGAFSLAYASINKLPVNRLSLNGVAPTALNFIKGEYPMVRQMGLVWDKVPSAATQRFIDFIFSPEGVKVLQNNGFVPVS
ncbi:substrate-binding domain-containing protein [Microseira sp. BLCC-F43]|jgi:phosphate transport system substrate-binding protein|uniref:substrate-binding domain-containing protein n=1 Tax=Microseira sp. BLCC-F43 TaxID=3153602 RepID=UPI0035B8993B